MDQKNYVSRIKDDYTAKEPTKLDELKRLDGKVKTPALIFAYSFGVIAALIMGVGMCFAMKVIGANIMSDTAMTVAGVVIGCVGIALCVANYFIYKAILKSRKTKYGNKIIELSNELLNQ